MYPDPLLKSSIPDVTFYDEPQEREFTSSGGHESYDNGVEVTVPPDTIPVGSTAKINVQPSLATRDVFVMPADIQSASPSYLIFQKGHINPDKEVTVTMEHHVKVTTREEADSLLFLQAEASPRRSASGFTYQYEEVKEGRSEFTPGENKGKLTTKCPSKRFFKIGLRARFKKWLRGMHVSLMTPDFSYCSKYYTWHLMNINFTLHT